MLDWNFLIVSVDPLGAAAADAPCLANSVRVVAWLSCTTERAQPMVADNCGAVGNATLVCDPLAPPAPSCIDSDDDGRGDRWTRQLTLSNLADAGCRRAANSQLVLHIGVIRDDNPAAAQGLCSPCSNVTIPPGDCFRYRLRVRRP
ncbi:MAG: hypothetical protein H6705_13080 [Myxococcales bacterium]|nr:hypothetical protein [Myxococcales bacterium]